MYSEYSLSSSHEVTNRNYSPRSPSSSGWCSRGDSPPRRSAWTWTNQSSALLSTNHSSPRPAALTGHVLTHRLVVSVALLHQSERSIGVTWPALHQSQLTWPPTQQPSLAMPQHSSIMLGMSTPHCPAPPPPPAGGGPGPRGGAESGGGNWGWAEPAPSRQAAWGQCPYKWVLLVINGKIIHIIVLSPHS